MRTRIWQLWLNSQWSLEIFHILTGGTWGASRTTVFRLFGYLVCSRVDYGSLCTLHLKEFLSILDLIYNSEIRLCTLAFRTCRVEGLYAESGEPALATRRQLCSYASELSILKKYPSCGEVHQQLLQWRFKHNQRTSRPAGTFKELLDTLFIPPHPPLTLSEPYTTVLDRHSVEHAWMKTITKSFLKELMDVWMTYPLHSHLILA